MRPAIAFDDRSWSKLTASETRVLLTLALSQPRRVSTQTLLSVYGPEKTGSARLMHRVVAHLLPAAATFGVVIVEDGEGYRLTALPPRVPSRPKRTAAPAAKPQAEPVPAEAASSPRSEILDLWARGYRASMIAARLRVPYAEVSVVLGGASS